MLYCPGVETLWITRIEYEHQHQRPAARRPARIHCGSTFADVHSIIARLAGSVVKRGRQVGHLLARLLT
jgi:hypothetical protein